MNGLTKTILLGLAMFLMANSVDAQTKWQTRTARSETNKLKVALNLDDEISKEIFDAYLTTLVTLKDITDDALNGKITEEERKKECDFLWQTHDEHLESLVGEKLEKAYTSYVQKNKLKEEVEKQYLTSSE